MYDYMQIKGEFVLWLTCGMTVVGCLTEDALCLALCGQTCTAYALARQSDVVNKLCQSDGYHDGDIGGGQYLNAAVWFETITGQSVVGNTYRPVYKYGGMEIPLNSEITYEMLQEAAHAAVTAYHSK